MQMSAGKLHHERLHAHFGRFLTQQQGVSQKRSVYVANSGMPQLINVMIKCQTSEPNIGTSEQDFDACLHIAPVFFIWPSLA
eukprot:1161740-Pelagomonas_calceolata.AAC.3